MKIFLLLLFCSCLKVGTDENLMFKRKNLDLTSPISFESLKVNFLEPFGCINCHNNFSTAQGLTSYVTPGLPSQSSLYLWVESGRMPKNAPALSENNIEYLKQYILQLSDHAPNPPTQTDEYNISGPISFEDLRNKILQPNRCLTCHQNYANREGLAGVVIAGNPESSLLFTWVKNQKMPKGGPPLTNNQIEYIKHYILKLVPLPLPTPIPTPIGEISFDVFKNQILIPHNCIICHSDFENFQGVSPYLKPAFPEESILYELVKTGAMPKDLPMLSDSDLELVRHYILNLPIEIPTPIPNPEISFDHLKTRIIIPHCLSCHRKWESFEAIDKYIENKDPEASAFYKLVENGKMPKGRPKLSIEDQEFIRDYILGLDD